MRAQADYLFQDFFFCSSGMEPSKYILQRDGKALQPQEIQQAYDTKRFIAVVQVVLYRNEDTYMGSNAFFVARDGTLYHPLGNWPVPDPTHWKKVDTKKQSWTKEGVSYRRDIFLWESE